MKSVVHVFVLLVATSASLAQGYGWEGSPRFPDVMPSTFVSVELTGGYASHTADVLYSEYLLPCCTFTTGSGLPVRIGVSAEKWITPALSVGIGAGLLFQPATLYANGDTLPRRGPDDAVRMLITEYVLTTSSTYAALELGTRIRLYKTPLSAGAAVRGNILISSTATLAERIIEPANETFPGTGTSERTIETGEFARRAPIFVEAVVSTMYDLELGRGTVITPMVQFSLAVSSVSTADPWNFFSMSVGLRFSRGF